MIMVQKLHWGDKDYVVLDKFTYSGTEYILAIDSLAATVNPVSARNLKGSAEIRIEFLYKREDGLYENVVDDKLYDTLTAIADERKNSGNNEIFNLYMKQIFLNNQKDA